MSPRIDVDRVSSAGGMPSASDIRRWVRATLPEAKADAELCIRIVDEAEIVELNARYRDRREPTNVLSFPADIPSQLGIPLLGDVVICAPVVNREALEQHKDTRAHWAHMVVHGTLHLLGFDHQSEEEAANMESLETRILAALDFPDPYETH
jgi:probable rRNA maturation factor